MRETYDERIEVGVAREQARKDLPLSTYTYWYWKIDLKNLLHFLNLRLDSHAQWEIQQYAHIVAGMVKQWLPQTWEAFDEGITRIQNSVTVGILIDTEVFEISTCRAYQHPHTR